MNLTQQNRETIFKVDAHKCFIREMGTARIEFYRPLGQSEAFIPHSNHSLDRMRYFKATIK